LERDLIVRQYLPGDEDQIVKLLQIVFQGWPHFDLDHSSKDHWDWKFLDNPIKNQLAFVAEFENKIVGCDHMLMNRIKLGRKIFQCKQAVDAAVHPNFRGIGVYSKIRAYEMEVELDFSPPLGLIYYASGNPIIINKEEGLGYRRFPHPIVHLVRILNVDTHLKKYNLTKKSLLKYGYNTSKILDLIQNSLKKTKVVESKLRIVDINRFDERIEIFWDKIKDDYSFITEKSRKYLNWRYSDPRGGKYIIKEAEEDGAIIGYVVLRVNNYVSDYHTGFIVDLNTLWDHPDCADALIAESLRFFDETKINIVNYCIVKGHPYEKQFKKFGLVNSRNDIYVAYRSGSDVPELEDFKYSTPGKMLFQYGDIDWI
jgi:hypothetical protein